MTAPLELRPFGQTAKAAAEPGPAIQAGADWQAVHAVADQAVGSSATTVERLLSQLAEGLTVARVEQLVREVGLSGVLAALPLDELFDLAPLLDVAKADPLAGPALEEALSVMVRSSDRAGLAAGSFTRTNPLAIRAAREQVARMVRGVRAETRRAIREVITASVRGRFTVRQSAVLIRNAVGLSRRQARAMSNYNAALHDAMHGGPRGPALRYHQVARPPGAAPDDHAAMRRAARRRLGGADRRFAVSNLTPEKVEKMTRLYGERALRWRASMIARTETMTAANRGLSANWQLAADRGLISPASQRVWVTTPDERLCAVCGPMTGVSVGLTEDFVSSEQGLPGEQPVPSSELTTSEPPIHPMCRCTLSLQPAPMPLGQLGP